ncbi:nuclear-interacting partner of ALK isoform X1 [Amblyraja radiata]|uniref:nuclear-interacting partner of ALK isoform X1 n=1 Tax=Amblyraja radiata TaxID=386614 RepID=UPI001401F559|nr:nuclear-interacting partner of ALK isoform X1 [Amblyraja radiata]
MAACGSDGDVLSTSNRNVSETPQKVRQLLSDSIAETDQSISILESPDDSDLPGLPAPCDSANKEAFYSRVETFTSFKWAGMSLELSPLHCAKYGWTNIECDVLKCFSCQAFLCATLHPLQDVNKYKERLAGLQDDLKAAHKKFCFWPDSPCPDRFWTLPLNEPAALLHEMAERFKCLCVLDTQLPVLKQDDLGVMIFRVKDLKGLRKDMKELIRVPTVLKMANKEQTIKEETISLLLQLVEDELKSDTKDDSPVLKSSGDLLPAHVSACVLALSGWTAGTSSDFHHLPVITCSYCMRKVGLWSFQQIDTICSASDPDGPVYGTSPQENRSETSMPTPSAMSPRRMITRSQDAAQIQTGEQHEITPMPIGARTRSRDAHSPTLVDRSEPENTSPLQRIKRPVTRSMGQGDVPSSPQRKPKRLRLSSSTSSDSVRGYFNPVSQHREWCPWIRRELKPEDQLHSSEPEKQYLTSGSREKTEPSWITVLEVLLSLTGSSSPNEGMDSFTLSEKSRKVFRIFRQWQVSCSL